MNSRIKKFSFACALAAAAVGCATAPSDSPDTCKNPPKHIVFIGFDGLGGHYIDKDLKIPNLRKLMREGAWTLQNRSILPSSSAANWASIFMAAGSEQHGYNNWNTTNSVFKPLWTMPSGRFPDVFACAREQRPSLKLGICYQWGGIAYVVDTNACDFVRQSKTCVDTSMDYLKGEKPNLLAFAYDPPDDVGHGVGWGTPEYRAKVEELDLEVGKVLKALEEAGMTDDTVVIVGSDHGGVKKGHGGATVEEMDKLLVFWGRGVKRGYELKTATFSYDMGATMAWLLGVKMPQICIGRPIVEAFE